MDLVEPLFKACEGNRAASRALVEAFTGDAPVYSLLKHPATFASALKGILGNRLRG
jgi:hypothetical protein